MASVFSTLTWVINLLEQNVGKWLFLINRKIPDVIYHPRQARNQMGGHLPPEIFKTFNCIANFDICRNFQRTKMKFYILIIFKKSYQNFSLSCSIISLQDLSWDRLSGRKFCKWLVFNHKYAVSVNLGDSLNCWYFLRHFYLFVRVLFCLRQASICPHETL